jgi:L-lactate dehydrogenase complex protein LldE
MRIAVFGTCLAEAFAPEVADAAADLVARARPGAEVTVVGEACCGQPAWNAGYPAEARSLARRLLPRLSAFDLVVVPSGSCATMFIRYYPHLFPAGDPAAAQAEALAARTRELAAFLAAAGTGGAPPAEDPEAPYVFHPSCHSLRGVGVGDAGERCLAAAGCPLRQQAWPDECCGFGGLFAVKQPALSTALADRKLEALLATGARTVVAGELGCLLHLEGRARRRGLHLRFRHLAEVLARRSSPPGLEVQDTGEGGGPQ